jgi:hypothetical protein
MFVRDEHGVELAAIFADRRDALEQLLCAHSGVNQNPCFFGRDQNGITRRTASENCNFHFLFLPRYLRG